MVSMPQDIFVKRSDPVYMAHAYLTKVPLVAIEPFITAFTKPGDIVVDPFAGSGMTGIAAALHGRRARLFDISVLGQHIGLNYVNLVEPLHLTKAARQAVEDVRKRLGDLYDVTWSRCGNEHAALSKTTWSVVVRCPGCVSPVNFYRALESAGWQKSRMRCPACARPSRVKRLESTRKLFSTPSSAPAFRRRLTSPPNRRRRHSALRDSAGQTSKSHLIDRCTKHPPSASMASRLSLPFTARGTLRFSLLSMTP